MHLLADRHMVPTLAVLPLDKASAAAKASTGPAYARAAFSHMFVTYKLSFIFCNTYSNHKASTGAAHCCFLNGKCVACALLHRCTAPVHQQELCSEAQGKPQQTLARNNFTSLRPGSMVLVQPTLCTNSFTRRAAATARLLTNNTMQSSG